MIPHAMRREASLHLVVFDVDGTLARSSRLDTRCYSRAVAEYVRHPIDTDWSQYVHQTDSGILMEVLQGCGWGCSPWTTDRIKGRFLDLLREAHTADRSCCKEVAGAREILQALARKRDVQVAIATGAWADSARLKLHFAGIEVQGLPLASADDAPERSTILEKAIQRGAVAFGCAPRTVTYVGDAPWDVAAARAARVQFVGVASGTKQRAALATAGAGTIISDFLDKNALEAILHPVPPS